MNDDVRVMVEAVAKAKEALERATILTDLLPEGARDEWAEALEDWERAWDRLDAAVTEAFNASVGVPGVPGMPGMPAGAGDGRTVYSLEYRSDGVWAVGSDGTQRRVTGPVQEGQ